MKNFFKKIGAFAKTHVKTSIAIGLVVLIGGYSLYRSLTSTTGETTYTLGTVARGTVVSSITGSGQVSTDRELDLKPQASGNVVYVPVAAGQTVSAGDLIAELDPAVAQKSVRDAEANLASAELSLQKVQEPADSLSLLQAQNALAQSQADLAKAYDDGFSSVSSAFLDLPTVITGLDSVLHATDANTSTNGQQNISYYATTASQFESQANSGKGARYSADAEAKYQAAKAAYDKNFSDYKNTSSVSDQETIQSIINETYGTSKLLSDAVRSATNLIQYYQDVLTAQSRTPVPKSANNLSTLAGYTGQTNTNVSDLLNAKTSITNGTTAIPEKTASLQKLQNGADPLDLQSSELSLTKAKNSLQDAKDNLANYYVRAPFSGTLATVGVKVGDPASSGTAVATLIANQEVVSIPLNEVDVSKVKLADKATLTFDAVDGLTLTGKVASIDTVGTVTQGVVNYTVTISFDSTDPRVKPGMSTTASIITKVDQDVLVVPSSAVKSSAAGSYILAFAQGAPAGTGGTADETAPSRTIVSATPPEQIPVTAGISDDTNTEIINGLTEGQSIVIKSVTATAKAATTATASAPSLLGGGARTGAAAGGNFRAAGR